MAKKPSDAKIVKKTVKPIVKAVQKEYDKIDDKFDKNHVEPKLVKGLTKAFNDEDEKVDRKLVGAITKRVATYGTKKDIGFAKKAANKVLKKKKK
jgi:hypothetical protein